MGIRSDREIARSVQQKMCNDEDAPTEVGEYSIYPHGARGGLVSRIAKTSQTVLGIDDETEVTQYIDPVNGAIILIPHDEQED